MSILYLLDTNVLSEPLRQRPNALIIQRFQEYQNRLATATVVWHELLYGISRLPASKRRSQIEAYCETVVLPTIPILPYDARAARWHAEERARLGATGLTPSFVDSQIAAIAATNGLAIVTFNTADYKNFATLEVLDWST
ncbi:MAG: type II toxin-antitoxin system VapC family toxin [Caldilineaceae bacterium]|nr:type II toxin-antitoxin system VapC family toxin [Caldilineaceae bacterium]